MICIINLIKNKLISYADKHKVELYSKFIKVESGGYGEGDTVIGVSVPNQRIIAKNFYKSVSYEELENLLNERIHEFRLTALLILVYKYENSSDVKEKKEIINFYISNILHIDNWDLVDQTAYKIIGHYLYNFQDSQLNSDILYEFTKSDNLWIQRIAIVSTLYFIKKEEFTHTFNICKIYLSHKHHLIHKACGWMLREVGKKNKNVLIKFLQENYNLISRTTLRYSIEKFSKEDRDKLLKGDFNLENV